MKTRKEINNTKIQKMEKGKILDDVIVIGYPKEIRRKVFCDKCKKEFEVKLQTNYPDWTPYLIAFAIKSLKYHKIYVRFKIEFERTADDLLNFVEKNGWDINQIENRTEQETIFDEYGNPEAIKEVKIKIATIERIKAARINFD